MKRNKGFTRKDVVFVIAGAVIGVFFIFYVTADLFKSPVTNLAKQANTSQITEPDTEITNNSVGLPAADINDVAPEKIESLFNNLK